MKAKLILRFEVKKLIGYFWLIFDNWERTHFYIRIDNFPLERDHSPKAGDLLEITLFGFAFVRKISCVYIDENHELVVGLEHVIINLSQRGMSHSAIYDVEHCVKKLKEKVHNRVNGVRLDFDFDETQKA